MNHPQHNYRKWLNISKFALIHNIGRIRRKIHPDTQIMAVVKADAYGHGSVECAKIFLANGASHLAVSSLGEAIILREHNVSAPILILGYVMPEDIKTAIKHDCTLTVYDIDTARAINAAGHAKIHIKLNTGMNRLGFYAGDNTDRFNESLRQIKEIAKFPNIKIHGIFSHIAHDIDGNAELQFNRFTKMTRALSGDGLNVGLRHICNSDTTFAHPEMHLDMVRPGIALYGYGAPDVLPAMSLETIVINVMETDSSDGIGYDAAYRTNGSEVIAVIPVGYADGLARVIGGKLEFEINGKAHPQVGTICMDMCMLRVQCNVKVGDTVTIFGGKQSAADVAATIGTIPYEILCRMGKRLPRVYC